MPDANIHSGGYTSGDRKKNAAQAVAETATQTAAEIRSADAMETTLQ